MSSLVLTLTESNSSVANNTSDVTVAVTVKFTDGRCRKQYDCNL